MKPKARLALVWSTDMELAEAVTSALEVMGFSALVPGARSFSKLCRKASLIVIDRRDEGYVPERCRAMRSIVVGSGAAEASLQVLTALGVQEVVMGIDPGQVKTGYALLAKNSLVYGAVLEGTAEAVASQVCSAARHAPPSLIVGVGASPSMAERAHSIAQGLRSCGVNVAVVNEHGSNAERPLGLRRLSTQLSIHVWAAAAIALRARMSGWRLY